MALKAGTMRELVSVSSVVVGAANVVILMEVSTFPIHQNHTTEYVVRYVDSSGREMDNSSDINS